MIDGATARKGPTSMAHGGMLDFDKLAEAGWLELLTQMARAYRRVFGRDLALTQELGELHACAVLGLERATAGTTGYDALDRNGQRVQIKSRAPAPGKGGSVNTFGTVGRIHSWEFDYCLLVLFDSEYRLERIWRAERPAVEELQAKVRNPRRGVPLSHFIRVARTVHPDLAADGLPRREGILTSDPGTRKAEASATLLSRGVPDVDAALAHLPDVLAGIARHEQHHGYKAWKIPRQGRPMNWLQWNDGTRSMPIRFANSEGELRTWKLFARFAAGTQLRSPWEKPEPWARDYKFMPAGSDVWGCAYEGLLPYLDRTQELAELLREDLELSYRYAIQQYG